jgi:hypothetical protein
VSDVPGTASVHIDGLIHGIVWEGGAQSNLGPTTLYTTFCDLKFIQESEVVKSIRRGAQKEPATCIPCILVPWDP